ncbi:(6-4)DNA photolyase (Protein UV repair defective 3) [Durusdinium trenchii]|uniref:(6-4)DNA photolyase (Protein UV repair defective 3) n=2 Tax=Durusdinium trenchii TaxID=1381693 RepID=A0ABP0M120_9DINO
MPSSSSAPAGSAIVWFRKGLRLRDNAPLVEASKAGVKHVCPIFVIDPHFGPKHVGINRYNFLLDSLKDLDKQLSKRYRSRLMVLRGKPEEVIGRLLKTGKPLLSAKPTLILWEKDTEPYALKRDAAIIKLAKQNHVEVRTFSGHTLWDVEQALAKNKGKAPTTNNAMQTLAKALGEPAKPLAIPSKLPPLPPGAKAYDVPTLKQMGYAGSVQGYLSGGETAGAARMATMLKKTSFIRTFKKPQTRSTAYDPPDTTMLSPYFKFGCVSIREFYWGLKKVCSGASHSKPPESLLGQIYFREMAYLMGASIPNFDQQAGNPSCKQIPWAKNPKMLAAWEHGRTGFPYIDAAMRQLNRVGWMHHLARHAVACFLTRGDLWLSWEQGRDVFDKLLLDADWALNNMNWLALAGVAPWSPPFFRVYHPVPKMDSALNVKDPEGKFIREFVPELGKMPSQYIYAPWTAPMEVQKTAGCIIGKDYPKPMVDHDEVCKANLLRFKRALSKAPSTGAQKRKAPPASAASASTKRQRQWKA